MPLPPRQRPQLEDIERRILYSADTPGAALAATLPRTDAQTEQAQAAAPAQTQPAVELVVLDERVPDADALLADIAAQAAEGRSIEVVRVGAGEDGVAAITAALAGRSDVAALHIVSHGGTGAVQLGQEALDNDTLLTRAADIAGWSGHLASGADILLYGCDVASDDAGRALVQGLADLTGADVAASLDATGATALGGNWTLEMQTGAIEARLAFDLQTQAQWQGLLATYTVTSTADSGAGTLRQAITDANANAGADTIAFNIAGAGLQTINLSSALPTITGATTINGYTQSDATANSASTGSNAVIRIALNGSGAGAGANGLNFGAGSAGSSVRGLAIGGFNGAGILTSVGGLTVAGNFIGTNAAGSAANANTTGVSVAGTGATSIGSAALSDRNLVSGNTNNIVSSATGALTIQGNLVGTNTGGSTTIGTPTAGISISAGTANAVGGANAGEGNVIAGGARGVVVTNAGTLASIVGNTISQTTVQGIDLANNGATANDAGDADTGPNALQNFPVLTGTQTSADGYLALQGTLNSTASTSYRIDFYASPSGTTVREGRVYLGSTTVTTDSAGNVSFAASLRGSTVAVGALVSATATRMSGTALAETSEFSAYQSTTAINVQTVTTTAFTGPGSLWDAIEAANAASGPTLIRFNIAGTGLHTITFPPHDPDDPQFYRITQQVIIDGSTDDSFAANGNQPAIQIDASGGENVFALTSSADGSTIHGLALTNLYYTAIYIEPGSDNNVITGNYIGTIGAGGQMLSTSMVYGIWVDSASNNRVGGSTAADRNVFTGITGVAITVSADGGTATGNLVQGNYIGVMPNGLSAVNSPGQGIQVATPTATNTRVLDNWIARTDYSAISVNAGATGTTVQGNRIGTDAAGTANWGVRLAAGIYLSGGAADNLFQNNVVAFSGANGGILLDANAGTGNAILANQIYSNTGLGIDLGFNDVTANDTGDADTGANNLQNYPVLTLARTNGSGSLEISGTLNSTANTYLRIELFANTANDSLGYGEGQTYLGFVNVLTDGSGNASFSTTLSATVAAGAFISATATRSVAGYGSFSDTSEFARSIVAISTVQNTLVVTTAADTVDGDTTSISTLLATKGADGNISLREALLAINNTPAGSLPTLVNFNISGNVVHTITLASALPYITKAVVIDGTTDTGSVTANGGRPAIVINVNGIADDGLRLAAGSGGSTIRGLVIQNYAAGPDTSAIRIMAGSDGNTIAGNYLGAMGANGEQAAVASGDDGIWIQSSNNTIGGNTAADRNVIGLDGRSDITTYGILITAGSGNQILGNYVGVNASGTTGFTGLQSGIWINGSGVGNTRIENNLVSGAGDVGIAVSTSGVGTQVLNNRIGINAAGTGLISTTATSGITIFPGGAGAVVSGNWIGSTTITGMSLRADGITAQGNRIGTDLAGTANWGGRQSGIRISANNMLIGGTLPGQGNIVAFSNQQITTADAISVTSGTGNAILGNSIYGTGLSVGALGIDLDTSGVAANDTGDADTGANNLQNFPVLAVARTNGSGSLEITGSINSTANTYIRIELFSSTSTSASGYGEGQTYLGFVNVLTDGSGNASFSTTLSATVAAGAFISATATKSVAGYSSFSDTSEFARSVVAISTVQNTLVVDTAADTVDGDTTSLSTLLATKGADGFISLREVLLAINGTPASSLPTLVNFGISGTGVHTITLGSELPTITRPVVINATTDDSFAANSNRPAIVLQGNGSGSSWSGLSLGTGSSGSTVRGLVIRGFDKAIYLQSSSSGNTIVGNYLGPLQADGSYTSAASAQTTWGVLVEGANNTIGGTAAADRNVIAGALGSGANIGLQLVTASGNRIIGNYLGTNASGTPLALGGEGVYIRGSASNNQVGGTAAGEGNLIAGSGLSGVSVSAGAGTGNAVLANSIYANGGLGIDLGTGGVTANDVGDADTGPNNLQNFPVLTVVRTNGSGSVEVSGSINSTANTYIRIELFASTANDSTGYGEGQTYLGFVNVLTNGSGNASFSTTLSATVAAGAFISATATKSVAGYGSFSDTSEFARSVVAIHTTQQNVLVVTTAADTVDGDTTSISTLLATKGADGFISLREALIAINNTVANGLPTLLNFNIAGTGVHTITLGSALPAITRPVFIDGRSDDSFVANGIRPAIVLQGNGSGSTWFGLDFQGGSGGSTVRGLVIRGFNAAIYLQAGSDGNTIVGNYIGALQADGSYTSAASAQTLWGVEVASANNTIGGTLAADRNVISGMQSAGAGVSLETSGATGNRVIGNYLGTDANGTPLGLGAEGVITRVGASDNRIGGTAAGEGNLIAGSALRGIWITPSSGAGNAILGNSIYANAGLGIDLETAGVTANDVGDADTGPNNLQNFPVLTVARTNGSGSFEISGSINSTANTYIRIELFASTANDSTGYGEGQTYLGFVNVLTDGSGNASFSTTLSATVAAGAFISATATRSVAGYGSFSDTSEFARSVVAIHTTQQNVLVVTTAADTVDGDTTSISTLLATKGADGFISLREALIAINNTVANGLPTLLNFGIAGTGVHTITLGSALPAITRPVFIDGRSDDSYAANGSRPAIVLQGGGYSNGWVGLDIYSDDNTVRGLVVQGFEVGVYLHAGSDGNTIAGNYIGPLQADGSYTSAAAAQSTWGMIVSGANNTIGGTTAADRNVISGLRTSGAGIYILEATATGNRVIGNYLGSNASATPLALGGESVLLTNGAANNQIGGTAAGEGNLIAGSQLAGVWLATAAGSGNAILGNSIHSNGGLGIDLGNAGVTANDTGDADTGANNLQNFPVLTLARTNGAGSFEISGTINSTANTYIRIEIFANTSNDASGYGEGQTLLGFVNVLTNGSGNATFSTTLSATVAAGAFISATATRSNASYTTFSDTSEFARSVVAIPTTQAVLVVTTAADTLDGDTTSISTLLANKGADGFISLREALTAINNTPAGSLPTLVRFAIAGTGLHTITLTEDLPHIARPVVIDGTTDDSYAANGSQPAIQIVGNADPDKNESGLVLQSGASGSTIRGLAITNFDYSGIYIEAGSNNNTIAGNYIGSIGAGGQVLGTTVGHGIWVENGSNNRIGGSSAADRNVFAGIPQNAILIQGGASNVVQGNYINVMPDGLSAVTSTGQGILVADGATNTQIGGLAAGEGNWIVRTDYSAIGVVDASGTTVQGNRIGTDAAGTANWGTRIAAGMFLDGGASGSLVQGNVVAFSGANAGILLTAAAGAGNAILSNRIYSNAGLGIDLGWDGVTANDPGDTDTGVNNLQNFPVLDSASLVSNLFYVAGSLNSEANKTYRVEFFGIPYGSTDGSGNGEGHVYLGFLDVTTDASGNAAINATLTSGGLSYGAWITATATEKTGASSYGSTSEFSVNVQAANTAPALTVAASAATTENAAAVALAPGATAVDTELAAAGNYAGATLTLQRNGGANAQDLFAATGGSLSALTQGGNLVYGGTTVGTVTTNSGGTLVLTFNANATQTLVDNVLRAIGYANSSDAPPASVQLDWSFSDGNTGAQGSGGALIGTGSTTVAITAVNDAPVLTTTGGALAYTENAAATAIDPGLTVSDVDSANLTGATVSISANYVNGQDVLAFVNANGITGSWNAATGVLTLSGSATLADYQAALRSVTYVNTSDNPSTATRTVSFVVNDGTADSLAATRGIAITAVNDAPVVTTTGSPLGYTENAAATAVDPGVTASDADNTTLTGATVSLSANYANGQDVLAFVNANGITGNWNAATGVLTLSGSATLANYQAALRSVTYVNTSDNPSTATRTVSFVVNDGTANSVAATRDIAVTAVNDAPVITSNGGGATAAVSVAENGTAVTTVTATDADGTTPTYAIAGGADAALFSIDSTTGALRFIGAPDHENPLDANADNVYEVIVRATDGALADDQALSVTVTNVNEAPVGAVTDADAAANTVAENAANGTVVGVTAFADDPDTPDTVSYSLTDNAGGRFAIDASTGVVTVADGSLLNYEAATSHQITVLATSSDGSTASANFTIGLADVNEAPVGAVTDVDAGANTVAENAANGTVVGVTAQALDPDGTATVSYSLTDNAGGRFTIDASTGVVTVANGSLLNYEAASSHQITVLATSSDGSTSSANFTIALGDVNEAPVGAVADVDAAANTVAENAASGTVVGITTQAIDPDGTATVSYSLTDNAGGRFTIDASTGVVTVADGSLLNYEAASSHQITVLATSSDGSASSASFTINLADVNEAPVGAVTDVDAAANTVAENAANGTVVGVTAQATDPDGTATVSYSLSNNAGGRFAIDASTGVVTVADGSLLDHETASSHQITVLATSSDGSTSSANFTIALGDVNEAPVGAVSDVDGTANTVAENAANGMVVGVTAQATDPDGTATVTYSLTDNAGGRFAIDASTGVVTVADGSLLNYEAAASHQITVLATSSDGSTSSANFTIGLTDVNEAPVGAVTDADAAANTVPENAANGTVVGITAQALDPDGTATVTYSLTDNAGGRFTVDASTGVVSVADGSLLDHETAGSHQITVLATSSDGSTSSANFTIGLADVNEAPVGAVTDVNAAANSVAENATNGTVVGVTAQATDPDGTATVTYSLTDNAGGRFAIDASTGVVTVADGSLLNYEAAASHQITVLATSSDGSTSSASFTINLTDVNEAPVGAVNDVNAAANQVAENAANGTAVGITAQAVDPDGTATVSYSLTDNAGGRFTIDANTGVVTVADGSLLDFEAASSHQITVLAASSDGSTSSTNFTIALGDVNEAPVGAVADVDAAANTVAENATNGTVVGITTQAIDPDGTATVTYSLTDNAGGRFAIDASTGVVTVADGSLLNYEAASSHQITVLATSSDGSTSSASFTIGLTDVNEAPVGAVSDVDGATNTVAENATNGTVVGITAQATDPDGTASVSYSLTDNAGGRFTIDASTGVVTVADGSLLNYEAAASHQITVLATSSDGSTSSANFTIGLTDVNEAPVGAVTDVDATANSVAENAVNGTVVGVTAQALDPDSTASVTYSLTDNAGGRFAIDANTGVVTVADGSLLDYETAASHQITVLATSSDGSTASANFTIGLADVNEAPVGAVTDGDAAANTVAENAANGTAVGITAQALDPDGTATVSYSLTDSAGGRFTIDASTGVVTVADGALLNYEAAASHQITVLATSSDGSTSSANFTIALSDVNEAPVGAVTDVDAAANTVPENAANGTVVGVTAQAVDPDGTATVTYSLSDNAGGRFAIDANTGVVTVADGALLNYEAASSHQITVLATSSDGSTSSANFTIALGDVNEAPVGAVGDVDGAANTVPENAANGTVVGITAQAVDPDGTASVTYSLTDNAGGRFAIDASTGVVTVADGSLLNYEAASSHQITVLATSSDGSTSSANFTVGLTDVNEAPVGAVTDVDGAANTVPENAANGTVVGVTAQALDPDGTATVTYSLSDNAGGRFAIDASTGVVTVANASLLDFEAAASHQITVLATSSDGSTSSASFTVSLGDVNEAPVGAITDIDAASNTVAENATNGTVVGITAQALDPDGTATVSYSLTDNAGGRFAIDASTGVVTVADGSLLNYEAASSHQITVRATSSDGSTSSANFTIGLADVNEAPVGAVTDVDAAANTVPENAANGTVVGVTAQAIDPDGTATVTYSLSNDAGGRFAIDTSTGVITVGNGSLLDHETASSHQITVLATSSDGSTSSATFTIALGDLNEAPVGAVTDVDGAANTVPENAANGSAVGVTAQALDPDGTATVTYSLTNDAGGRFTIDASTGVVTVADGSLLDHETASSHQITVLATSSDGSTSSANFTINLADVNEAPVGAVTDVDAAANTVPENAATGTVAGITAQALDPDGTASVSYSLTDNAGGRFTIDASTGVVTVANGSLLNYESATSHQITVLATSSDGSTSSANFTIGLTDVNEAPVGAVTDVDPAANTVPENAANGTVVGVTAQALDPDGTASVTYSLSDNAGGRFAIDASTGAVTVADGSLLDHETASSHQITVLATSSDGSTSSATFTIALGDVNETPVGAVADVDAAANTVPENATTGTVVGITAHALDPDGTATVSYSLSDNAGGRFVIDASTGVVTVANGSLLNYESAGSHQITVLATSSDGSTSSANFTVNLADVNEAPVGAVTDVDAAANTVAENAANGTVVGITAQATDPDGTATVSYSLSNNAGGRFAIDASTGVVTVADGSLLNHEAATSHQITVLATSSDGSTSSTAFTIALGDVNEAPVGTVTDVDAAANTVPENATTGTVVGITAQAIDPDGTATVTYSLTDNAGGRFTIDANTGVVTVADGSLLDYETASSHQITVLATSSDGSTSSMSFTVALGDANEAPVGPVTDVDAAANTVPENAANGTAVGITAHAIDPDGTASVAYSLTDNAGGRFAIDANTGVVTVANASLLDHESATSHQITVRATSSDGSTSSATFTIALGDVNEAPLGAIADVDPAANQVPENAATGTPVGITAQAVDPDGTATVSYTLSDDAGGRFTIDPATGVVTVADGSLLDYEGQAQYQITVLATSSDGSSSSLNFTVQLTDVNEVPVGAISDIDPAPDTVPENAATGTPVGITVQAVDPDGTATVRYSLSDDAGGRFAIDADTGLVTVADGSLLDYEGATSHQITVLATSSDGSTSSASFTVALSDVNEAVISPVVDTDPAPNRLPENATTGTPVGITAFARDPDAGATVSYALLDDAGGRFAIDASTGVVTVADGSLLDYESATTHGIVVRATSSDGSTTDTAFTIALADVNEFAVGPSVDTDPTPNRVDDNAATGATVGVTVQAVDADGSNNTVRYSLSDDAGGRFAIDAQTGVVTVADGTRLQDADGFTIKVLATSSDGSSSETAFNVAVRNTNVQAPVITSAASVAVPENSADVLQVTASDADSPASALVYSIVGGADAARFSIDAQTGALRFTTAPDVEIPADANGDNLYDVRVRVSDGRQSSEQQLAVQVTPVNDNAPRFTTPGGVVELPENSTAVVRVQAVDADLPAETLRYSIVGGADAARFTIDAQTGALRFVQAPDREAPVDADGDNDYAVVVGVSDGLHSASLALTVRVRDVVDGGGLPGGTVQVSVPEQQTAVTTVQASGTDGQPLQYALAGGADAALFTIDAATGRLAFRAPPLFMAPRDADGDNLYEVLVRVSDGERTGDYRVLVTVTGNPVVQPNPVPAAPVPGPTPPVAVAVPPNLPATGAGQSLGSDPAAGEAGATDEGGLQFAGGADMVHADHVPGTRPAPAVLLAPATQQPLPADLLLRVQWRQSDYHAAWGDIGLPDLLLPDLLRSEPVDASAQTSRGPQPDALPVVADTAEEGRDGTLQASAALDQALAGGIAIGLGAAFWASRGSALLASLLAMSPAWTSMDPLPVLNRRQRGPRDPRAQQPFGDAREDNGDGTEPEDARRKDEETVAEDKQ